MQPDPEVFLPAIRRQALRPDLFGSALESGLSPILMQRAGEGLLQLALRQQRLPQILRGLRAAQRTLLRRAAGLLRQYGVELPDAVGAGLALRAPRGAPGEPDVACYETLITAIGAAIGALSVASGGRNDLDKALSSLCKSASLLEERMRSAYKAALAELRADIDVAFQSAPPESEPGNERLTAFLRQRFPQMPGIEARNLRRLPGMNTQEIYFCDLVNCPGWDGPAVLRRASAYNPTQGSMANEFELLNHLQRHGVPVPRVLVAERDPVWLDSEFSILERLRGAAQLPQNLVGEPGRAIALEMARVLARVHSLEARELPHPYQHTGQSHAQLMLTLLDDYYRRWQAGRIESSLTIESAYAWMRANVDCLTGPVVLVHGDCNFRNILIDGARVSALLDWELSHLGHPAEDLAYIRPDVELLLPWPEFMAAYRSAGGRPVSDRELGYLDVWTNVWRTSLATWTYSGYIRGQHQNFLYASCSFNEYYVNLDMLGAYMTRYAYRR